MRHFNTSGPCNPIEHYTVLRRELIASSMEKIRRGKYLTIFAPRQAGKTTFFHLLMKELVQEGQLKPIKISFENMKTLTRERFYEDLDLALGLELPKLGFKTPRPIRDQGHLATYFAELRSQCRNLVLVIDEFEGIPNSVLDELMHTFRRIYHERENHALHSLILVGVSTIAELIVSSASPFNIVDEIAIPYFSFEEVRGLIGEYTAETGQRFEDEVIKAVYENSAGQPGLTCALCAHLVEMIATDKTRPVTMDDFYKTLQYFLTEKFDKNILNIVQKAREKQAFMLRLLFSNQSIPFTVDNPDIAFLFAHGVVENFAGAADILVPLYKKRLLTAFRPASNGETGYYISAKDNFSAYLQNDGLNIKAILQQYAAYVVKRGFRAFDVEQLKEGAWHYSLDGFINFFMESLGGQTFVEVPSGRGRTDILILFRGKKYIIETKIFSHLSYFEKGKRQLAEYVNSEGLAEGYYVVFSSKHGKDDVLEQEEMVDGKRIITRIIRIKFERPSTKRRRKK